MAVPELPMPFLSVEDLGGGISFGKNRILSPLPSVSLESYSEDFYRQRIQRFRPGTIVINRINFPHDSIIANEETRIELTKKDIINREDDKKRQSKNVKIAKILTIFNLSDKFNFASFPNEEVDDITRRLFKRVNEDQEISAFIIHGVDNHSILINLHPIRSPSSPESEHKRQKDSNKEEYYFKLDLGKNSPHHDNDIDTSNDRIITLQILDYYKCKKGKIKLRTGWKSKKAFESLLYTYITIYPRVIAAIFQTYGETIPKHIEFSFPQS